MRITEIKIDSQILHALKRGNRYAFRSVFQAYYPSLLRFSNVYTKSITVSEELVQEVFIKIWNERVNIDPSTFSNDIFLLLKHQVADYLINNLRDRFTREQIWINLNQNNTVYEK